MSKRILLIEPYYGGSHKQFLDGMIKHIPADFTLWSLPARKWKMRMQLAAPWFAGQLRQMDPGNRWFDTVCFSTFIDVALFKALVQKIDGWNDRCRYLTYFHENQFEYPGLLPKQTLHQFTAINFASALVSDSIAFNSHFNRNSFLNHVGTYLAKAADIDIRYVLEELEEKSLVLYPGIDFTDQNLIKKKDRSDGDSPLIIWNHRWEHDKNPEEFFSALIDLEDRGISFRLALLGQRFRDKPHCFTSGLEKLADRIIHTGFLEDRQDYYRLLAEGDVIVSTARHEFFGIAVIEAVRAGCTPVLPDRLSYPELFEKKYLYQDGCLSSHLQQVLQKRDVLPVKQRERLTRSFSWEKLSADYEKWLGI